jgi:hypothetical protein
MTLAPAPAGDDGCNVGLERGLGLEMLKDADENDLVDACVSVTGVVKVWRVVLQSLHFYNWFPIIALHLCHLEAVVHGKRDVSDNACIII